MLSMNASAMVASIHEVRAGMPKKKMTMPTFFANSRTARTMCCVPRVPKRATPVPTNVHDMSVWQGVGKDPTQRAAATGRTVNVRSRFCSRAPCVSHTRRLECR